MTAAPRLGDRALFPDLDCVAYLNHAAVSPPSLAVRAAARAFVDDMATRGVAAFDTWRGQRERLRGKLATLIGAAAADVALLGNTTAGVQAVAMCFPWCAGDRVAVIAGEFPANVTPWQAAAERFGVEVVWLPQPLDAAGWDALGRELERGLTLLAVSAVQFQTGRRMPLEGLVARCRAAGTQVFVDAIQACGVVPIDVAATPIDYLACGGHKWLMGLEGQGFLYVRPERIATLRPVLAGWLSHEDTFGFLLDRDARLTYDRPIRRRADFLEGGCPNAVGCAALEPAVDALLALGVPAIARHVAQYLDALERGLVDRGFRSERAAETEGRSGILAVVPPEGVDRVALCQDLGRRGVSCARPDGRLRFAPHWPNALSEVPAVLAAVDAAWGAIGARR